MMKNGKNYILYPIYFILFCIYSIWSYSLTDPNLVLTSWLPYWNFQQWMWQTFFNNSQLLSVSYTIIISLLIFFYLLIIRNIKKTNTKYYILYTVLLTIPLFFSYNALSHDVFNYIFNAKMVAVYHADPHTQVALDFADDDWTRFMHNTHTSAPYGRLWTYLSLIPFYLGFEKFILTWVNFRLFSLVSFLLYLLIIFKSKKVNKKLLPWILFNPLILIEIVSNIHNDFWMLTPAILSFTLLSHVLNQKRLKSIDSTYALISLFLLVFSIYIKLSTLTLVPLWAIIFIAVILKSYKKINKKFEKLLLKFWPLANSIFLFIPLLTPRSQQFHPWYLSWVLVWIIFFSKKKESIKNKLINLIQHIQDIWFFSIIVLSFSSLLRYLPYIYQGEFTDLVILHQKLITWIPFVSSLIILSLLKLRGYNK